MDKKTQILIIILIVIILILIIKNIYFVDNFEGFNEENKITYNLEYIHIPKTAGSSIEKLGEKYNINWGMHSKRVEYTENIEKSNWHNFRFKPSKDFDYFTIVRNPYDRLISEYYYLRQFDKSYYDGFIDKNNKDKDNDITNFKKFVKDIFARYKKEGENIINCHITPQSKFVYDDNNESRIQNVIKMENNMSLELDKLFKKYNLGIDIKDLPYDNKTVKLFNKEDLDDEIRDIIYEFYKRDFELLGYEKNNNVNIYDKNKKIALCFLIYEEIYHEDIWYKWLETVDKSKYNIYIHYKTNKPLKYFDEYKLKNTINNTCWGCFSIVEAQNLLIKEVLVDKNNKHIVWLSDSCIPVKSFDYIYNNLEDGKSYFNYFPQNSYTNDIEVISKSSPIRKEKIKKAGMPSIICSNHAKLLVNQNYTDIKKWFDKIKNVDEKIYITLLHYYNKEDELVTTNNLCYDAVIYYKWKHSSNFKEFDDSKYNKKVPYEYNYICEEELNYLIKSKSLFARKFSKNCGGLKLLLQKINSI